jgi:hypothetical protein
MSTIVIAALQQQYLQTELILWIHLVCLSFNDIQFREWSQLFNSYPQKILRAATVTKIKIPL